MLNLYVSFPKINSINNTEFLNLDILKFILTNIL